MLLDKQKRIAFLTLAAFLIFVLLANISNYIWLRNDNTMAGTDVPLHLLFSVEFYYRFLDIVKNDTYNLWNKFAEILHLINNPVENSFGTELACIKWPNGINLTALPFYFVIGKSLLAARLSMLVYLNILLISVFLIGRIICNEFVGFLSAVILFMYPLIFESSRQFALDFPLTAMVSLCFLLLIKCNNFKDRKYSLFLGLALGWGMIVKGQIILFLIWPILLVLWKVFRNPKDNSFSGTRQRQNIAIFLIFAGLIASIWWARSQNHNVISIVKEHVFGERLSLETKWQLKGKYSLESLSYHLKELGQSSLSPFQFLVFLTLLPTFLRSKVKDKHLYLFLLIMPCLIFVFVITNKPARYLMPLLPMISLISAYGFNHMKTNILRTLAICLFMIFSVVQFYFLSYGKWENRNMHFFRVRIFGRSVYSVFPRQADLKIDEIGQVIKKQCSNNPSIKIIAIRCANTKPLPLELIYLLRLKDRSLDGADLIEMPESILKNFDSFDVIILLVPIKSIVQWPEGEDFKNLLRLANERQFQINEKGCLREWNNLLNLLANARKDFELIGKIPMEETQSIYYIYKRLRKS